MADLKTAYGTKKEMDLGNNQQTYGKINFFIFQILIAYL